MKSRRDGEEKEYWTEGGRDKRLRSWRWCCYDSEGVAIESMQWYHCALEQTVIETTLINFNILSPSLPPNHHTQACNIQEAVIS